MITALLMFSIVAQVLQQVCRKEYNKNFSDKPLFFSCIGVLATLIYFIVLSSGKFTFLCEILLYVIPFSICYTTAYICSIYAIRYGPLSITSLVISCSVVVPLIFGVAFLKEPISLFLAIGIALLFLSIALVSKSSEKDNTKITPRWIFHITATFFSNGICMSIQKLFQIRYTDTFSNVFMILSLAITFLFILVVAFIHERNGFKESVKSKSVVWPILCGAGNGVANHLTLMLAVILPASILYPIQSAGGIILTAVVSLVFYKEKLSAYQKLGFVFGVLAIILFNI